MMLTFDEYEGWHTRTQRAYRNIINCYLERLVRKTISTRARRSQRYLTCDHITDETETMAAKSVLHIYRHVLFPPSYALKPV